MVNQKHTPLDIAALISILLLIAQLGTLSHSVEHLFHAQDQSCQIFLQSEQSGNGLVSPDLQLPILFSHVQLIPQLVSIWLPSSQSAYSARAPPSSL